MMMWQRYQARRTGEIGIGRKQADTHRLATDGLAAAAQVA